MVSCMIIITAVVLSTINLAASQICGNTGNCTNIVSPLQCTTVNVLSTCCSKCISLAGCQNLGLNCQNENPLLCYQQQFRDNCCAFCAYRNKVYLGGNCLYGDKSDGCGNRTRCNEAAYASQCCETCFTGTVPTFGPTIIAEASTTPLPTAAPPATTTTARCINTRATCELQATTVPSDCYQTDMRQACCASCAGVLNRRSQSGVNVTVCPYGDKGAWCLSNQFDRTTCGNEDIASSCCDTCVSVIPPTTTVVIPTTVDPTCRDTGVIANCDFPDRFCYTSVSQAYSTFCCQTCAAARKPSLGATCIYGDKQEGCADLVTPGVPCTAALNESCCGACQAPVPTTTVDPCQDTLAACPALVSNDPANCYQLEGQCCRTCRQFLQASRPNECRFGNRIPNCRDELCEDLEASCCATCADRTTTQSVTTTPPCIDTESNCELFFGLDQDPSKCYNEDVKSVCCASCKAQATGPPSCPYGDRDSICRAQVNIDCEQLGEICCKRCAVVEGTTTVPVNVTLPPDCSGNTLATCSILLNSDNRFCYPEVSALVSSGCCESCALAARSDLPPTCRYGNRVTFCDILATEATCESDAQVRLDCCESCYYFVSTTTVEPTTPSGCIDVYAAETCELLKIQLGSCASIEDKCCASCRPTTTQLETTTVDLCVDVFGSGTCELIIGAEGQDECYTDLLQENCCGTCKQYVTTPSMVTTPQPCNGTQLPNCGAIQLIVSYNICNESSTFATPCCEYCRNITYATTTPAPACDNKIDEQFCIALIQSSTVAEPCDNVEYIKDNCCGSCSGTPATTSTTTTMPPTTTGIPCDGDEAGLNCAGLNDLLGGTVCDEGSTFVNACCAYCREDRTTQPTTSSVCTENIAPQCQIVYTATGGTPVACASDYMIENCCHFCANLPTVPPTTPDSCTGDDPLLNCSNVYVNIPEMCDAGNALREFCCDFCRNPPVPTTTAAPTTTEDPCKDNDTLNLCDFLVTSNQCDSQYANDSCCATCRAAGLTTVITQPPTTTTMAAVTTPCVDTTQFDCADVDLAAPNNLCDGASFNSVCCAYCSQFTTTTPGPTTTPLICNGDQLGAIACQNQIAADNETCNNPVLRSVCCATCGLPVVGDSTTVQATTTAPSTIVTDPTCTGDVFRPESCLARIGIDANTCADPQWYSVCCDTCNNQGNSRRKRSIALSDVLVRSKRQSCRDQFTPEQCVNIVTTSDLGLHYCFEDVALEQCCGLCSTLDLNTGMLMKDLERNANYGRSKLAKSTFELFKLIKV